MKKSEDLLKKNIFVKSCQKLIIPLHRNYELAI